MRIKIPRIDIKTTITKYRRVVLLMRKPTMKELKEISRICAMGISIIGIMGFFFYIISVLGGMI